MDTTRGEITEPQGSEPGFWVTVGTAIAGLARRAGCSAEACPLPEIRAAAADLREWDGSPAADEQRLAI